MTILILFLIGLILGAIFKGVLLGTQNALDGMDRRDREEDATRRREWMAMNREDRDWYNRYGRL